MTITRHNNVLLQEEQVEATAKILATRLNMPLIEARNAVVDLATHDMTEDTHWRQGLSFVFIVYSGTTQKFATICIDPLVV